MEPCTCCNFRCTINAVNWRSSLYRECCNNCFSCKWKTKIHSDTCSSRSSHKQISLWFLEIHIWRFNDLGILQSEKEKLNEFSWKSITISSLLICMQTCIPINSIELIDLNPFIFSAKLIEFLFLVSWLGVNSFS